MAKNDEYPSISAILPKAVAIYPKLNEPDTKFDSDGVYETKLKFDPDGAVCVVGKKDVSWEDFKAQVEAMRDAYLAATKKKLMAGDGKAKQKAKTIDVVPFGEDPDLDDEGEETGLIVVKAKMKASGIAKKDGKPWKRSPKLFDARGKVLDPAPAIWGGSVLKVAVEAQPYYTAKDNVVGVTMRLQAAQVIELVSGGGNRSAESYGFGAEEEGYSATADADDAGFSDEGADDADF